METILITSVAIVIVIVFLFFIWLWFSSWMDEWLDESPDSEAVEFHEWVGKQGYKLSHYAAKGEAVHLHESKGSTPFHELREGDWRTTSELYDLFKQSQSKQ